jgi:hypothetical protein
VSKLEKPFRYVADAAVAIPPIRKLVEQHQDLEAQRRALKAELEQVKGDAAGLVASPDEVYASVNGKILDLQRAIRGLDERERELGGELLAAVREHQEQWAEKYAVPAIHDSHARLVAAVDELRAAITDHQAQLDLWHWLRGLTDMRAGVVPMTAGRIDYPRLHATVSEITVGRVLDLLLGAANRQTAYIEAEKTAVLR